MTKEDVIQNSHNVFDVLNTLRIYLLNCVFIPISCHRCVSSC